MDKMKVIFRKDRKDGTIIAFFPECSANYGNIVCYQHIGQNGEASLEYYYSTVKANPDEYEELYNEVKGIYGTSYAKGDSVYELDVKQRLCYDDLIYKAWAWRFDRR